MVLLKIKIIGYDQPPTLNEIDDDIKASATYVKDFNVILVIETVMLSNHKYHQNHRNHDNNQNHQNHHAQDADWYSDVEQEHGSSAISCPDSQSGARHCLD